MSANSIYDLHCTKTFLIFIIYLFIAINLFLLEQI